MRTTLFLLAYVSAFVVYGQQKLKIACIGDGLTKGNSFDAGISYPQRLQQIAGDQYEVRNFGLNGRTILKRGDSTYWIEPKYKEALEWNPDFVIIEFGINDSKPQNWIYSEDFESEYADFIKSFKNLSGGHRFILCLPPAFNSGDVNGSVIENEIIPLIKKIGASQKAMLIDLYALLSNRADSFPDGIHPDAEAAALIADEVYNRIK